MRAPLINRGVDMCGMHVHHNQMGCHTLFHNACAIKCSCSMNAGMQLVFETIQRAAGR